MTDEPISPDPLEIVKRRVYQRLGTDQPRCAQCGETHWRCLELRLRGKLPDEHVILCRNCVLEQAISPEDDIRKRRVLKGLGTEHPVCLHCARLDWRCFEADHIARRAYDDQTGLLCANCHRKKTDPADNGRQPDDAPRLERFGRYIDGLADFLAAIVAKLRELAQALLQAVPHCPPPWGTASDQAA